MPALDILFFIRELILAKSPAIARSENNNFSEPPRMSAAPLPAYLTEHPDGVTLAIKLQPRAAKNEIGEPIGAELRIRVTAPPVEAAANEALIRLLAATLDCPRGKVELVRGHTARHKLVRIYGATPGAVMAKIRAGSAESSQHQPPRARETPSPKVQ